MKIRKKNHPKSENFPCPGHSGYFTRKWMWAPHGPSLDQLPPMIVKGTNGVWGNPNGAGFKWVGPGMAQQKCSNLLQVRRVHVNSFLKSYI